MSKADTKEPEVVSKDDASLENATGDTTVHATLIEQLNQYTDRPDLFLAELEKHDPGFIKEMNQRSKDFSDKYQESRFKFGERQAYISLGVSVVTALTVLAALFYMIHLGQAKFLPIFGLVVFYSISQAGSGGIKRFLEQLMDVIDKFRNRE